MDKLPVSEEAAGLDDLRGEAAQRGEAIRDSDGVLFIPHPQIQSVQHLPAGRQGGVDVHGLPEGIDGFRGIAQSRVTVATLLVQAAVTGMQPLQALEYAQRLIDVVEQAQFHGLQAKLAAVLRELRQRFGRGIHDNRNHDGKKSQRSALRDT